MPSSTVCSTCYLRSICLPRDLNQIEITQLENLIEDGGSLDAGSALYQQGQPIKFFALLRSGMVKSVMYAPDGTEQVLGFYLPGQLMGLDSLETGIFNSSAIALERVTFCLLPQNELTTVYQQFPHLQQRIMVELGHEIVENHRLLLIINHKSAEKKLAIFLTQLSAQRHQRSQQDLELSLAMSRSDIGNFLGLAPETVSRALSHLETQQLIEVSRRHILIKNLEKLHGYIADCGELKQLPL